MRVIVCLDDRDGMCFNHRRQSRDRAVIADILATVSGSLRMTAESAALFTEAPGRVIVTAAPLAGAEETDTCFIEVPPPAGTDMDELIVYRWGRVYPADRWLDIDRAAWRLTASVVFAGYSHEKITREVWKPCL